MKSSASTTVIQHRLVDAHQEPPILHVIPLPPISAYERVIIDDDDDDDDDEDNNNNNEPDQRYAVPTETTPLVGVDDPPSTPYVSIHPDDSVQNHNVACRDWQFSLLFFIQLLLLFYTGIVYSPQGYQNIAQFLNYTLIPSQ
jgi:hypothetical protein